MSWPSSSLELTFNFFSSLQIDRQQFEETVRTLNNLYAEAEKLGGQSYLEGCLACLTAYTIFLCMETHYEKVWLHLCSVKSLNTMKEDKSLHINSCFKLEKPLYNSDFVIALTVQSTQKWVLSVCEIGQHVQVCLGWQGRVQTLHAKLVRKLSMAPCLQLFWVFFLPP
jgi:hypothetical protein